MQTTSPYAVAPEGAFLGISPLTEYIVITPLNKFWLFKSSVVKSFPPPTINSFKLSKELKSLIKSITLHNYYIEQTISHCLHTVKFHELTVHKMYDDLNLSYLTL